MLAWPTFYVSDKEGEGTSSMVHLVGHGCGGCMLTAVEVATTAAGATAAEAAVMAAVVAVASASGLAAAAEDTAGALVGWSGATDVPCRPPGFGLTIV